MRKNIRKNIRKNMPKQIPLAEIPQAIRDLFTLGVGDISTTGGGAATGASAPSLVEAGASVSL
jgi:hypothetical protein